MHYESPLAVTVKGAVAGVVGTAAMTGALLAIPKLIEALGRTPPDLPTAPGVDDPVAALADKVAEGVLDTRLDKTASTVGGQALHWGYGIGWGAAYGILQSSLRLPHLLHGTILGILLGVIAETIVPTMRVVLPADKRDPAQHAMQFTITLVYGWVTALVFNRLSPRKG